MAWCALIMCAVTLVQAKTPAGGVVLDPAVDLLRTARSSADSAAAAVATSVSTAAQHAVISRYASTQAQKATDQAEVYTKLAVRAAKEAQTVAAAAPAKDATLLEVAPDLPALNSPANAAADVLIRARGDTSVYTQPDASTPDNLSKFAPNTARESYTEHFAEWPEAKVMEAKAAAKTAAKLAKTTTQTGTLQVGSTKAASTKTASTTTGTTTGTSTGTTTGSTASTTTGTTAVLKTTATTQPGATTTTIDSETAKTCGATCISLIAVGGFAMVAAGIGIAVSMNSKKGPANGEYSEQVNGEHSV